MMTEMITEDTPDNGEEMWQYKLDAMSKRCEMLTAQKESSQDYADRMRRRGDELEQQVRRLTDNMTVRQLRNIGAKVNIVFPDVDYDDDYDDD